MQLTRQRVQRHAHYGCCECSEVLWIALADSQIHSCGHEEIAGSWLMKARTLFQLGWLEWSDLVLSCVVLSSPSAGITA